MYKVNLVIEQGSDFTTTFNIRDENGLLLNLTGYTGAAQMRPHYESNTSYDFAVSINVSGTVTVGMTSANTVLIPAGRYVWDCELTNTVNVTSRPFGGQVRVEPSVTR
jgi:hypothetical protein